MAGLGSISPFIAMGSGVTLMMSKAISAISESVADAASLTIPIYNGTKKIGYRKLNKQDFKLASENISLIVTTLGNTFKFVGEDSYLPEPDAGVIDSADGKWYDDSGKAYLPSEIPKRSFGIP
jgi:hypothetical protein